MRRYALLLVQIVLLVLVTMPAQADRRVALVVGNGAYQNAPRLPNPRNDAEDVAASLTRAGFETIIGLDLDQNEMQSAAIKFARAARTADVALFYYSGHAMQYAGVNYLAPVDIKLNDEADLRRMIRVDEVVADLQQAKNLRILVLDSCRDNPLAEQLKQLIGPTRAMTVQRGLAKIDTAQGMIVAYATQAGRTAEDGDGRNSPYTAAFLKHIEENAEIGTVFRRVSSAVYETTNHQQLPELSLSLIGEFYLKGHVDVTVTPGPAVGDPCAAASDHWKSVEAIGTVAVFEDHLRRFPNCAFAGLANARLDALRSKTAAITPPPRPQSPSGRCENTGTTASLADQCVIRIGQTLPLSGPLSAYATIGRTQAAYVRMINDRGGVNGRRIDLIQYDDGYNAAKAVEQVRRLVESDDILFAFQIVGTPSNAAVQNYLNQKQIPQLFSAAGSPRLSDPGNFPWTIGFNPSYQTEGRIIGRYILQNHSSAKIGVLYQNDDFGRDYLSGLKTGLGNKAATMIVAEASYELTDSTIDSQIAKLRSAGADLLFDASTPKFAVQAIRKTADLGWKPVHLLDINATSVDGVIRPAGLDRSKGVVSVTYNKDPLDPAWEDDAGMKAYFRFMARYFPEGDKSSSFNIYGYSTAQLLIEVLKRCGDDLSRGNIMKQATSLTNVQLDLALPGIVANTSRTDYRVNKQLQMVRFNGNRWEKFGPIIGTGD